MMKRTVYMIKLDILRIACPPFKKLPGMKYTQLLLKANLCSNQLRVFTRQLTELGLLELVSVDESKQTSVVYRTTEKGRRLLERLKKELGETYANGNHEV